MKFFFPDGHDVVDPSFDFETETRSGQRLRQRDDQYPHEIFTLPPYDGVLVSKAIVDRSYSFAQKQRFYREGVRKYLRLDAPKVSDRVEAFGDCGAFSYIKEPVPPYSVEEVVNFYETCGFDYGVSIDHVILQYNAKLDHNSESEIPIDWRERQKITLQLATEFFSKASGSKTKFTPIGVAQGWSPRSYAYAVEQLQNIGYDYIALGGVVPMKSEDILTCFAEISRVRQPRTKFHLLGITRCETMPQFAKFGVASFDSTNPLKQAFKHEEDNYHTPSQNYIAFRIPQVHGNHKLKARIQAGEILQEEAAKLEYECLTSVKQYANGAGTLKHTLEALLKYDDLHDGKTDRREPYLKLLKDRPWEKCRCDICRALGVHVVIFRGSERNRRRGFHNLYVFHEQLKSRSDELLSGTSNYVRHTELATH